MTNNYQNNNIANVHLDNYVPQPGIPIQNPDYVPQGVPLHQFQNKNMDRDMIIISDVNFQVRTGSKRICKNCNKPYNRYEIRNGINIGLMILIMLLTMFTFILVVLFLCFCKQYRVCPNCRNFTEDERSNEKNVCLC